MNNPGTGGGNRRNKLLLTGVAIAVCSIALAALFARTRQSDAPRRTIHDRSYASPGFAAAMTGGIDGIVLDAQRRPVPDARVVAIVKRNDSRLVLRRTEAAPSIEVPARATSGSDGRFSLNDMADGEYTLTATTPDAAGYRDGIDVTGGARGTAVEIIVSSDGFLVSGRILDSGGGTVASARVRAVRSELLSSTTSSVVFEAVSGLDGAYRLRLPAGRYGLIAEADGYAPAYDFVELDGPETRDLSLQPAATIVGRVIEGNDAPMAGVEVKALPGDRSSEEFTRVAKTGERGEFEIGGLRAGSYSIVARRGELIGSTQMPIRLGVAETREVEIVLGPGFALEGTVRDGDGGSVAKARVWIVQGDAGRSRPAQVQTTSGEQGRYRLGPLLAGTYTLRADAEGFSPREDGIVVAAGAPTQKDVVLTREAVVTGNVVSETGSPIAGAVIKARVKPRRDRPSVSDETTADAQGVFALRGLCAGDLWLSARSDAGIVQMPVDSIEAGQTKKVTLRLQAGARVSGQVSWDDGTPAAGVGVIAQTRSTPVAHVLQARTSPTGSFSIGPLPAGDMSVHAMPPNERRAGLLPVDTNQVDLNLAKGEHNTTVKLTLMRRTESVRGIVEDTVGEPVGDAVVTIEREPGSGAPIGPLPRKVVTAPDGSFVFESLGKGSHTLTASHQRYPDTVQRGVASTSSVRLVFKAAAALAGMVTGPGGTPVTGYTMFVARDPESRGGGATPPQQPELTTYEFRGPKGLFSIGPLLPGTYKLTAVSADGATGQLPSTVLREGEEKRQLRVQLVDGRTVSAQLKDFATGAPLTGGVAVLRLPEGPVLRAAADGSGRLVLQSVPRLESLSVTLHGPDGTHVSESRLIPQGSGGSAVDLGLIQLVRKPDERKEQGHSPISLVGSADNVTIGRTGADSPATRMGFKPGDVVLAIDGKSTTGVGPDGMRDLMTAASSQDVVVTVRGQDDARRDIRVSRQPSR
jgi:hypothetical protein